MASYRHFKGERASRVTPEEIAAIFDVPVGAMLENWREEYMVPKLTKALFRVAVVKQYQQLATELGAALIPPIQGDTVSCKFKGCENEATGFVHMKVPNAQGENWDAVNPVRVDLCPEHLRMMLPEASFASFDEAHTFSTKDLPPKETHGQ